MAPTMFDLTGKVALVSGGSRGIGRGIAEGLAAAGATVVLAARDEGALAQAAAAIQAQGGRAGYKVLDVLDTGAIPAVVGAVVAEYGRIDILVNAAGVNRRVPYTEVPESDYDWIMGINMKGAYFLGQAVGRHMVERGGGGKIINITSLNSHISLPKVSVYAASKGGVLSLTRAMAAEWGRHGIQANAISPGFIYTDLTKNVWDRPDMQAWLAQAAPAGRVGTVADCVGAAIFLASAASDYINGQYIIVDGGLLGTLQWPL